MPCSEILFTDKRACFVYPVSKSKCLYYVDQKGMFKKLDNAYGKVSTYKHIYEVSIWISGLIYIFLLVNINMHLLLFVHNDFMLIYWIQYASNYHYYERKLFDPPSHTNRIFRLEALTFHDFPVTGREYTVV